MIGRENYYEKIKGVDFGKLDADMNAMKSQVDKITFDGTDWTAYENDKTVKETFDLYFQALELELKNIVPMKKIKSAGSKISAKDVVEGARFKSANGTIFIVDKVILNDSGQTEVQSSFDGGKKGNYNDLISDFIDFLNDEKAKKVAGNRRGKIQSEKKRPTSTNSAKRRETTKSKDAQAKAKKDAKPSKNNRVQVDENAQKVESFSIELKFIKRFVNLDGKAKNRNHIRLFISALQKAIREKRIRKTSKYAKEIVAIQDALIKMHGKYRNDNELVEVSIPAKRKTDYLQILGRQVEMPSVKLIKSYINLQGKVITNQKAKNLYNRIVRAIQTGKVSSRDKYAKEVDSILNKLKTFVKKNRSSGLLSIESKTLNGLGKIVGMAGIAMNGFANPVPSDAILTGQEIAQLKFDTLDFEGKWKDFMGQPNRGFSFMLSAKPKFGKTILAMQFADYLANNFGTVLYIASEEQIGATLQQKVLEGNYFHPDLFFTGTLPEDFDAFDFVFIDSVNNYGLNVEDLQRLKKENPTTSFGYIFQVTKDGVFRGSNEFQHDVDSIWEIPKRGQAVQFGRYNQGGSMNVFESENTALDGLKKK